MCTVYDNDLELIKKLKEKLKLYINSIVEENISIYHKIALYLFPPANNLTQFDEIEKIT